MSERFRLPTYTTDLIEMLDKTFPARCIAENERPEAAHRYAGKRELVEWLRMLKERADDNILEK